jgi:DinB superfamily
VNDSLPEILWRQLGGALQMLENAILACPDDVWGDELKEDQFWFLAYHTLIWTDYYASENTEGFSPPAPFVLGDILIGHLPKRPYTRQELLAYLAFDLDKSRALIRTLTPAKAQRPFVDQYKSFTLLELVIYNTRHVQHHAAQLVMLLRQRTGDTPGWSSLPERGLHD